MNGAECLPHLRWLRRARPLLLACLLTAASGCSTLAAQHQDGVSSDAQASEACSLSSTDKAWLDRALAAWDYAIVAIAHADHPNDVQAVIFDQNCKLVSQTALTGGANAWTPEAHSGEIALPDGNKLPAQVVSFAAPAPAGAFFVMAAPRVWRTAGVESSELSLEQLTTAVMLHEAVHVLQFPTYGSRISRLAELHALGDDFSDDSIQQQFAAEDDFAASIGKETALFLAAADAADRGDVLRLAAEARELSMARHKRWFTGELVYLSEAEDVWLTLEGSAQWVGYQWLIDPRGAGLPPHAARRGFGLRGKSWSQKQGFALFAALDRLLGHKWKQHAFGDGAKTAGELLDEALRERTS